MNKSIFFCFAFILFITNTLSAQDFPVPFANSSHSAPSATTFFNFDITDSAYFDPLAVHQLLYRDQGAAAWNSAPMAELYPACSSITYSGAIGYTPPSDILEWYFHSENDTAVVTQSPKNEAGTFPVPSYLMADLGADVSGDVENGGGSNLDITHLYGSYSDTKLYFQLENNGGGFPTGSGLFTYYIYSIGILDPDATDSVAYVLMYANAVIYNTGLYAMDLSDSSFTQIGSVSSNVSGNKLSLSCNISDLVAQPGWPSWPPESGFIGASPVTATATLTSLTTNDFGKAAVYLPSSNLLDFTASNSAPALTSPNVDYDETGLATAEITYTDPENNLPVERTLFWESTPYDLVACEKDYRNGALFYGDLTVTETGWYKYYFEYSDGVETASTPLDSIYIDLTTYICGDVNDDGLVNVLDIVYLIDYKFKGGPAPIVMESADVNFDGNVNVLDIVYLIDFKFKDGPDPVCS